MQPTTGTDAHWERTTTIWQENTWLYGVVGIIIGLLLLPLFQRLHSDTWAFLSDLVPEAVGIGITVLLIDRLYERREAQRRVASLRAELFRDIGSRDNSTVLRAIERLKEAEWLEQAIREVPLYHANFDGADLGSMRMPIRLDFTGKHIGDISFVKAILHRVCFDEVFACYTDFRRSDLRSCSFRDAIIEQSQFQEADASSSKFINARMIRCDFTNVLFSNAKLNGADLSESDLTGAYFDIHHIEDDLNGSSMTSPAATLDARTTLPDRSRYNPELGLEQLERFTNPKHPNYWRSHDPLSPAYRHHSTA